MRNICFNVIPRMRYLDCSPRTVGIFVWTSFPTMGHLLPCEKKMSNFLFQYLGRKGWMGGLGIDRAIRKESCWVTVQQQSLENILSRKLQKPNNFRNVCWRDKHEPFVDAIAKLVVCLTRKVENIREIQANLHGRRYSRNRASNR